MLELFFPLFGEVGEMVSCGLAREEARVVQSSGTAMHGICVAVTGHDWGSRCGLAQCRCSRPFSETKCTPVQTVQTVQTLFTAMSGGISATTDSSKWALLWRTSLALCTIQCSKCCFGNKLFRTPSLIEASARDLRLPRAGVGYPGIKAVKRLKTV